MCSANRRSANRAIRLTPWFGLMLSFFICSEPLIAAALEFKPPRRGIPGRREGGGTREGSLPVPGADPCNAGSAVQFAALMPPTNFGLTTSEFPRFFWSTPRTKARFAEFTLHEASESADKKMSDRALVYRSTFRINGDAGIASFALPRNTGIPGLAVGADYHWTISLICNPQNRKQDTKVEGWVQRMAPDAALASQLSQSTPSDRPKLYADNGIWFDTLSSLADLRYAKTLDTSLAEDWANLLKGVNLPNSTTLPLFQPGSR
jgi:Domain of Unknown Function (DUF928)